VSSSVWSEPGGDPDDCAWARELNARWIVRSGLDRAAEEFLQHLEASDPARLQRSCRNARTMVDLREPSEDPKPWFYAGLFSLGTPEEAERFLRQHWLTHAAVSSLPMPPPAEDAHSVTEKLRRIREALAQLAK